MTGNQTHDDDVDAIQSLVRAFAEAAFVDPGEKPLPMATTSETEVIKAQLTENTGAHFLDSGGAYGRHHEENRENPPWERPAWNVDRGWVSHNVYDYMQQVLGRTRKCVALETALYAYGHTSEQKNEAWLRTAESFASRMLEGDFTEFDLRDLDLPDEFVTDVLSVESDLSGGQSSPGSRSTGTGQPFTANTYNDDMHTLSQVLQGVNLGGPYAEYVAMQVHQGADVRGGYTGPRVYSTHGWMPHELEFRCKRCDWVDYESCVYDDESMHYQRTIDPFELEEKGLLDEDDEDAGAALEQAHDAEHVDGAIFHECDDGGLGYIEFH